MTDVELPSTVPSSQQTGWPRRAALVAGAVVTVLSGVLGVSSRPAGADSLVECAGSGGADHRRSWPRTSSASTRRPSNTTRPSNGFSRSDQQITQIKSAVAQDEAHVTAETDQTSAQQAVASYMAGTSANDLQTLFSSGGEQATVTGEYQSVASGNISGAIDALNVAQTHLASQQSQLQAAQSQAQTALTQASDARQAAQATVADQQATLARVKGQIGTLVAQRQAAQLAASHAAFLARVAARQLPPAGPAIPPEAAARPDPPDPFFPTCPPPAAPPRRWRRPRARSACPTCGAARARAEASTARA